jgi:hypothetical protein
MLNYSGIYRLLLKLNPLDKAILHPTGSTGYFEPLKLKEKPVQII